MPVEDDLEADAMGFFDEVAAFIRRVEEIKGKLFVHCIVGCSRAPTFIIAWLMKVKRVALYDAYLFVRARRVLTQPNSSFMYQLTLYELAMGKGSSVKNKSEFQNYAFTRLKLNEVVYSRRSRGVFLTTLDLYRKPVKPAKIVLNFGF